MACRVGMTTDPGERKAYWEARHPTLRNWRIVKSRLTYDEALELEKTTAERGGCEYSPGGQRKRGRVWSVYRFTYGRR